MSTSRSTAILSILQSAKVAAKAVLLGNIGILMLVAVLLLSLCVRSQLQDPVVVLVLGVDHAPRLRVELTPSMGGGFLQLVKS